jgi:hypothetical protein
MTALRLRLRSPRRRPRLLALLLGAVVAAAAAGAPSKKDEGPETAALRRRVAQLRQEREVASHPGFYLRLDASRRRLALMLEGVTLDDYEARALEWGVPQVLFLDRRPPRDWDRGAFSKGRLEPAREHDRIEIVAPSPAEGASPSPPPPPLSAEEAYSVPSTYRIVFSEGVSLEVRAKAEGGRNRSALRRVADAAFLRLGDLVSALGGERVRLRVTLEDEDAASLYRSLPPDVGLLVLGLPPG